MHLLYQYKSTNTDTWVAAFVEEDGGGVTVRGGTGKEAARVVLHAVVDVVAAFVHVSVHYVFAHRQPAGV